MASLVVIEGPCRGGHFPLKEQVVSVGRDDTCTVQILDGQISRKHLQVRLDEKLGTHFAADYRSANGVFVNDKVILTATALRDGDRIRIGQTTLIYLAADHADAPTAMAAATKKDEWRRSTMMGPG